eukprot:112283_1
MPRTFSVEHARSGRSTCKCCMQKIAKSVIRMGTHQESLDDYPAQTKWFHLKCFKKKIRKGPPTKKDIANFDDLSSTERRKVVKYVFGDGDDSSSDSSSDSENDDEPVSKQKSKKRKRKRSSSDESSDEEPPKKKRKLNASDIDDMTVAKLRTKCKEFDLKSSGKKSELQERLKDAIKPKKKTKKKTQKKTAASKKEEKKNEQIIEELGELTVQQLKDMLAKNEVRRTGNKKQIMERVADCKMYGVYPRCPKCFGGVMQVKYDSPFGHKGQGHWFCKGYMDDDHFRHCHFKSDEVFERKEWKD